MAQRKLKKLNRQQILRRDREQFFLDLIHLEDVASKLCLYRTKQALNVAANVSLWEVAEDEENLPLKKKKK